MNHFEEGIEISGEILFFSFNRVYIPEGEKYFVTVQRTEKFYAFDMKKDFNGKWCVSELAAKWIKDIEKDLADILGRNTNQQS